MLLRILLSVTDLAGTFKNTAIIAIILSILVTIINNTLNKANTGSPVKSIIILFVVFFVVVFLMKGCLSLDSSLVDSPSRR